MQRGSKREQEHNSLEVVKTEGHDELKEQQRLTNASAQRRTKKDDFHNAMIVSVQVGTGGKRKKIRSVTVNATGSSRHTTYAVLISQSVQATDTAQE